MGVSDGQKIAQSQESKFMDQLENEKDKFGKKLQ